MLKRQTCPVPKPHQIKILPCSVMYCMKENKMEKTWHMTTKPLTFQIRSATILLSLSFTPGGKERSSDAGGGGGAFYGFIADIRS